MPQSPLKGDNCGTASLAPKLSAALLQIRTAKNKPRKSGRPALSKRLRKTREDPVVKLARTILPAEQVSRGDLRIVDISNHSDADQRAMVRSG